MTTMTHTPGPWTSEKAHHTEAEPDEHAIMGEVAGLGRCRLADVYSESNARLIAAAPEMLEFVREYLTTIGVSDHDDDHDGPDEARCTMANPLCLDMQARALLARIEGR